MFVVKNIETGKILRTVKTNRLNRVKAMVEGPLVQMAVANEWAKRGEMNHTALWEIAGFDEEKKKRFDADCEDMLKYLVIEEVDEDSGVSFESAETEMGKILWEKLGMMVVTVVLKSEAYPKVLLTRREDVNDAVDALKREFVRESWGRRGLFRDPEFEAVVSSLPLEKELPEEARMVFEKEVADDNLFEVVCTTLDGDSVFENSMLSFSESAMDHR